MIYTLFLFSKNQLELQILLQGYYPKTKVSLLFKEYTFLSVITISQEILRIFAERKRRTKVTLNKNKYLH